VSIKAKSHFKSDLKLSAFLEMLTKSVTMRATTATRAECVQRGLDQKKPFSGCGSRSAAKDDPRPNILQLNSEGLTDNKIFVIERLAQWFCCGPHGARIHTHFGDVTVPFEV